MLKTKEETVYRAIEKLMTCYYDNGGKDWIINTILETKKVNKKSFIGNINISADNIYYDLLLNKFTYYKTLDNSIVTDFHIYSEISDLDLFLESTVEKMLRVSRETTSVEYGLCKDELCMPLRFLDSSSYDQSPLELINLNLKESLYSFRSDMFDDKINDFVGDRYIPKIYKDEDKFVSEYINSKLTNNTSLLFLTNATGENYNICLDYFLKNYDLDSYLISRLLEFYMYNKSDLIDKRILEILSINKELTFVELCDSITSNSIFTEDQFTKLLSIFKDLSLNTKLYIYDDKSNSFHGTMKTILSYEKRISILLNTINVNFVSEYDSIDSLSNLTYIFYKSKNIFLDKESAKEFINNYINLLKDTNDDGLIYQLSNHLQLSNKYEFRELLYKLLKKIEDSGSLIKDDFKKSNCFKMHNLEFKFLLK